MRRPRLYTYIVRVDDGAAPNPFGGMCSLTICKPKIRSSARAGDWVAGVGSRNAPSGDLSGRLVYAMKVAEVMSMAEYDRRAPTEWPHRIPDISSSDLAARLGDCIYDFKGKHPTQRPGVHGPANKKTDLGGKNALIATDFLYFGSRAIPLPDNLRAICPEGQGHRSAKNDPYREPFQQWLRGLGLQTGQIHGWPDVVLDWGAVIACGGCLDRSQGDDEDEE
jgi:Nucleotide modification associated domain 2